MPTGVEPPVVAQSRAPAARDRAVERRRDPIARLVRAPRRHLGDDDDLGFAHGFSSACGPIRARGRASAAHPTATGIAPPGLDRLGQQVDLGPARRPEAPVERLDAVLPDADVDRLGLGGDVGPQLGAAPLGQQLDPQRGPGRRRRDDRADDDADLGRGRPTASPRARAR